jgi:predicted kinase
MNKHHEGPTANVISTPGEAHQTNSSQVVDDMSEEVLQNEREKEAIRQKQLFTSDWKREY